MASLYITEYARVGRDNGATLILPEEPPLATQKFTITGTSAQSNALNAATRIIRVHTDAICSIEIGADPTAAATTRRMAAGATEYFCVPPGSGYKVAGITNT